MYVIYMWNLKPKLTSEYNKKRNRLTDIEHKPVVTSGERGGAKNKMGWEIKRYKLQTIK